MAFDFKKLKEARLNRKEYLYKCRKCGEENWYSIELNHRLAHCHPIIGYCHGILDLIETKEKA